MRILLVGLILLFTGIMLTSQPVMADRNVSTITGYSASTVIKTGDWKIYRITYLATAAGGSFAIYDALTQATASNSSIKTEGAEAVSLNGKVLDFTNKPLEGSTGLCLVIKSCNVIVSYE